jgi:hypothetical protein
MANDIFDLLHNGVVKFQGTEKECRWKLLRSQEMSIQWATTNDGWEIKKSEPNETLIQNEQLKNGVRSNG